ncbi:hypothetical protein [Paramaledivibacter caminithermalis]|jgi:hypothetical protein|uniref:Uncharacterized protein n=1 Tax=Paramaledivibacter caminithermalis (strain DSM 15212 / CIP 107654 / DViRD3) TaxID=1121301 RepID=A0A1M6U9J7_PARC5|nr:hypothetical protein [Paramaledivibacter caminithermalis]SHK65864.1 hypothetical protein SAMN02745912_03902 [Paramaledivibacter caminithermalis DSM 15212]
MKKLLSTMMILILIFLMAPNVFAESQNTTNSYTVSEYELLKPYLEKNLSELLEMGLSTEEAEHMLDMQKKIFNKVKECTQYNEKKLFQLGYSEKQIDAFSKINSMDAKSLSLDMIPRSAWASVTFNCQKEGSINDEYWFSFDWEWTGQPFITNTDTIAFAWDNGFRVSRENITCSIDYYSMGSYYTTHQVTDKESDIEVSPGEGFRVKFAMSDSGPENSSFAKCGYGSFTLSRPNENNSTDIQIVWGYGHSTFSLGGFGLNVGFPSLSVNTGVEKMYEEDAIFQLN